MARHKHFDARTAMPQPTDLAPSTYRRLLRSAMHSLNFLPYSDDIFLGRDLASEIRTAVCGYDPDTVPPGTADADLPEPADLPPDEYRRLLRSFLDKLNCLPQCASDILGEELSREIHIAGYGESFED